MPKAAAHDRITVISAAALAPLLYYGLPSLTDLGLPPVQLSVSEVVLFAVAHTVSGYWFSPDLDTDSRVHRRWGPLAAIWVPYRCIVPHRHFWSHGLVVAPLARLLYLFLMLQLIIFLLQLLAGYGIILGFSLPLIDPAVLIDLMRSYPRPTLLLLAGFVSGSAAHSISDWLVSAVRGSSR